MGKSYRFVGDGLGIPGLPHEVTAEEAKVLGVEDILAAAVARGVYQEIKPERRPAAAVGRADVPTKEGE